MKIPKRFQGVVFIAFMGTAMVLFMSFALTGINTGFFSEGFFSRWLRAFLVGFAVSMPIALLLAPAIRRLVDSMIKQ